ncbi:MAG: short-chain dehydrogenase, partial [Actinobacteria bacterium]|nr:short-chain dehydrogenase [Actinomycetota bacterium]
IFPSGVDTPMLRYEATHGGSPLNFVGKVKTVQDIGDAVDRALRTGKLETYVPYGDSLTTRIVGAIPWSVEKVVPLFTKSGEKGRAAFIAERGLG